MENHGKPMENPWENAWKTHGKTHGKPMENDMKWQFHDMKC